MPRSPECPQKKLRLKGGAFFFGCRVEKMLRAMYNTDVNTVR